MKSNLPELQSLKKSFSDIANQIGRLETDNQKLKADNQKVSEHIKGLISIQKTLAKVTTIVSNLQADTRDLVSANRGRPIAQTLDGLIEVVNQMNHDIVNMQEMSTKGCARLENLVVKQPDYERHKRKDYFLSCQTL